VVTDADWTDSYIDVASATITVTGEQAHPTVLAAPTLSDTPASVSATSITLTAPGASSEDEDATLEYRSKLASAETYDDWQTSPTFSSLTAETAYDFQARYVAVTTADWSDSNASASVMISTAAETPEPPEPGAIDVAAHYGGTITPVGADGQYTVAKSADNYVIDTLFVDGVEVPAAHGLATYTTTVAPERSISASFAHTINFQTPDNGALSVVRVSGGAAVQSGEIVHDGDLLIITATAASGYELDGAISVVGLVATSNADEYEVLAAQGKPTPGVSVSFKRTDTTPAATYEITAPGTIFGGSVTADLTEAAEGATVTITVTPDSGYRLESYTLQVNGGDVAVALSDSNDAYFSDIHYQKYTFTMPVGGAVITAEFVSTAYDIAHTITNLRPQADIVTNSGYLDVYAITTTKAGERIRVTVYPRQGNTWVPGSIRYFDTFGVEHAITDLYEPNNPTYNYMFVFEMPDSDVWVTADFIPLDVDQTVRDITIGSVQHGTITTDFTESKAGNSVRVSGTAEDGYYFNPLAFTANGVKLSNTGTFVMPAAEVVITGSFTEVSGYATPWDGSGAEQTPWLIQNVADFQALARIVDAGASFAGKYFKLTANLNLQGVLWSAIGHHEAYIGNDRPFSGTFDGDYHTINVDVNDTAVNADVPHALFGYLSGATVRGITVTGRIRVYVDAASIA
jgi:hypothetical protein